MITYIAKKGNEVCSIEPEATVFEALQKLDEKNVVTLLVLHEDKVAGIISERDYIRKIILKKRSSIGTSIPDIMTKDVC